MRGGKRKTTNRIPKRSSSLSTLVGLSHSHIYIWRHQRQYFIIILLALLSLPILLLLRHLHLPPPHLLPLLINGDALIGNFSVFLVNLFISLSLSFWLCKLIQLRFFCLLNWNWVNPFVYWIEICAYFGSSILISRLIDSCLWFVWFILKKKLRVFSVHIDWFGGWVLKLIVMKMDRNAKIHNQTLSYWAIWFYLKVECWIKKGSSS